MSKGWNLHGINSVVDDIKVFLLNESFRDRHEALSIFHSVLNNSQQFKKYIYHKFVIFNLKTYFFSCPY